MNTNWKLLLDAETGLEGAESVVTTALRCGTRPELLAFLRDLYTEFRGPDPYGGEAGTLCRMRLVYDNTQPTDSELEALGISLKNLLAYFAHEVGSVAMTCA